MPPVLIVKRDIKFERLSTQRRHFTLLHTLLERRSDHTSLLELRAHLWAQKPQRLKGQRGRLASGDADCAKGTRRCQFCKEREESERVYGEKLMLLKGKQGGKD
jgi:hypothetical protein